VPIRGLRYTMEECAAAASTVLDVLGISEPVDWVGNAWGGHVGVIFATTSPARCRTLVTLGTPVQAYRVGSAGRPSFSCCSTGCSARCDPERRGGHHALATDAG
jgi:pimeloyl-ACP methyl ester carboxylesterase